jgi:hypothetical protein
METVSRQISQLKRAELLAAHGQHTLEVRDLPALRRRAEGVEERR